METQKNILISFVVNLLFSIFELIGGMFTCSVAILSDAVHDFGDSLSIGISYFLEKKSMHEPDNCYTYGYVRYSILGAFITTMILIVGSIFVVYGGFCRIINPVEIHYDGMILFAVVGVIVNVLVEYYTRKGDSINQRSVKLHALEDVLGWIVVLIGSILMKFTNISLIDPLMSIGVAIFIFVHAMKNFKIILDLFLEKMPSNVSINEVEENLKKLSGVIDVHHVHLWSLDGINHYATLHVVTDTKRPCYLKKRIREELMQFKIKHVTIELENKSEKCMEKDCHIHCVIDKVDE